jgi:histidinol phosphatase-like PHP family hydrolase
MTAPARGAGAPPAPRPVWRPLDCHAHTRWSDGALDVEELVATVRARGARPGVADHVSRDVRGAVDSVDEVRDYLDALEQYEVARGGEFCWHDNLWRELPDDLARRFTHRIGSLHAIFLPGGGTLHAFSARVPAGLTPDAYMEAHVANLERFAREMPVDILAHPTLVPLPWRERPLEELWTEEREERAVGALHRAGIAFELSNRYRPHERFVRRAAARGVRLSLGSDGHTAEQVGDLAFPLALARRVGVRDGELYDPHVHGSKTLELT